MTTKKQGVNVGQKELASSRERLQGQTLQFSYNLHNQPREWLPFQILELLRADPSNCPQGVLLTFHLREQESCCLPVVFRRDAAERAFPVLMCPLPIALSVQQWKAGSGMAVLRTMHLAIHSALLWTLEGGDIAGPRIQGTRGVSLWTLDF